MADVGGDRAQLILVTGLLIAVAMVSLVLLLNTAIFTENLASRGADQSGREAVEYRATVVDGVGGLIDPENRREHDSETNVKENVTDGIDRIDNFTARSYATGGTVVRINDSTVVAHEGKLIRQTDDTEDFKNESRTEKHWRLASDVEDTRAFTVTVDDADLVDTTDGNARSDGAFHVLLDGGSDDWEAFVYKETPGPDIVVGNATGGGVTERCRTSEPEATINLTAGTLNGESCAGLDWADGISGDYDIEYRHGGNASGTYNLTINTTTGASVNTTNLNDGTGNPTSPYHVPAVYSTTFNLTYTSPTLDYRSAVRVAPGESK